MADRETSADEPTSPKAQSGLLYPAAVALGAFVLLFALSSLSRFFSAQHAMIGHPAPDFALNLVFNGGEGDRIRLSDLKGHPVVLDFWATWCGPCQAEAPVLDRIAQRHRDRGLVVLGINTNDEPGLAAAFARQKRLTYPIAYDERSQVAGQYAVDSLPTLVIIDAKGNVLEVRSGAEGEREIERLVAAAY